jgi:hypothetical protein
MRYIIGGLVGALVVFAVQWLLDVLAPVRKREQSETERRVLVYWQTTEKLMAESAMSFARIADAVEVWRDRYQGRKSKKAEEVQP